MSLKAELLKWSQALDSYDAQDFTSALEHFEAIADSSKVLFNIGLIHATLGGHATAVAYYKQAHLLDQYMAVSFFQCGVSQFLMRNYTEAYGDFDSALGHMRENQIIDYDQLGLKFKLYSAEILFNMGLCMINMNHKSDGMSFLDRARREKQIPEHDIIDEAFSSSSTSKQFTVFSLPVGALFRPSPVKLKNLKSKNYLGSARLVAATEVTDAFTGFSGVGVKRDRANTDPSSTTSSSRDEENEFSSSVQPLSLNKSRLPPVPNNQINPLRTQKSVPDLRKRAGSTSATNQHQRTPSKPQQLPRLDTMNVPRSVVQPTNIAGARSANPNKGSVGGGAAVQAMLNGLPTPPDSPPRNYGMQYKDPVRKRVSSMTQLDYAQPTGTGKNNSRETRLMEELIDGYSERGDAMEISPYPAGQRNKNGGTGYNPGYPSPNVETMPKQRKNSAPNILLDMHQAPQGQSPARVADWAAQQKANRSPQNDLLRPYQFPPAANSSTSSRNMNNNNNNNGNGNMDTLRGGTLRLRRQNTKASTGSRQMSGSDYDEMMSARTLDMVSFRLKLHFEDEIRGMSIDADTSFDIFFAKLQAKFGLSEMKLKYKDEDGSLVTIVDETDWDSAVDAAREHCPTGRQDGKLEIWVSEI